MVCSFQIYQVKSFTDTAAAVAAAHVSSTFLYSLPSMQSRKYCKTDCSTTMHQCFSLTVVRIFTSEPPRSPVWFLREIGLISQIWFGEGMPGRSFRERNRVLRWRIHSKLYSTTTVNSVFYNVPCLRPSETRKVLPRETLLLLPIRFQSTSKLRGQSSLSISPTHAASPLSAFLSAWRRTLFKVLLNLISFRCFGFAHNSHR